MSSQFLCVNKMVLELKSYNIVDFEYNNDDNIKNIL